MAVDPEETARRLEVRRRLIAARTVRGIEQDELAEKLYKAGQGEFGKGDVGRIERGQMVLGPARRRALADILQVPEDWFTVEDPFAEQRSELDQIKQRQEQLVADVAQLQEDVTTMGQGVQEVVMLFRRNPPAQIRQRKSRPA